MSTTVSLEVLILSILSIKLVRKRSEKKRNERKNEINEQQQQQKRNLLNSTVKKRRFRHNRNSCVQFYILKKCTASHVYNKRRVNQSVRGGSVCGFALKQQRYSQRV